MTIAPDAPAVVNGMGGRVLVTDNPAAELGAGQRIVFAESAMGEVMLIVDDRTPRLVLDEKFILVNTSAGPRLVIVDADEVFFGPDPRDDLAPPVTGEPY